MEVVSEPMAKSAEEKQEILVIIPCRDGGRFRVLPCKTLSLCGLVGLLVKPQILASGRSGK